MKINFKLCLLLFVFLSGKLFAQPAAWSWAINAGGPNLEVANAICSDSSGNIYVTGSFTSTTLTLGTFILTNNNTPYLNFFLVKYDPLGNVLWAKQSIGISNEQGKGVCCDARGNVYVTGEYASSPFTLDTITLGASGGSNIFTAKYDSSGHIVWAIRASGADDDYASGIAVDTRGNVFICGSFFSATLAFGSQVVTNAVTTSPLLMDLYIAKYDSTGNALWARAAGGTDQDEAFGIATDTAGNAFITGEFWSNSIFFGSHGLTNFGGTNMFLTKYGPTGNVVWAKSPAGAPSSSVMGFDVTSDVGGNIYATGYFQGAPISFGTTTLTTAGGRDIFLVKYNPSGAVAWAKRAGGTGTDEAFGLAVNAGGEAFLTGTFTSATLPFNNDTLHNVGGDDLFVMKFDNAGTPSWAKSPGGINDDHGARITTDIYGNVVVAGSFYSSSLTFGSFTLTNSGSRDLLIAKISPAPTGIAEGMQMQGFSMYPNPATYQIRIEFGDAQKNQMICIYNMMGEELLCREALNESSLDIPLLNFAPGVYFLKLSGQNTACVRKFIVE